MGKKRNTAKTGDKAVYASRGHKESTAEKYTDDDDMYNDVDRYNNARDDLQDDVLNFNKNDEDSEEEGFQNNVENVFDLGIGQSDDESSSDSSSSTANSDEDEDHSKGDDEKIINTDDESSIEGMEEIPKADLLNWGKRKKDYYNGDTADLEIGQEIEDAELEEEAGKEVLKTRLEGMTENDFLLEDEEEDDDDDDDGSRDDEMKTFQNEDISDTMHSYSSKRRKLVKLSKSEKVKIMSKNHPELLPLISYFRDEAIRPCAEETLIVLDALIQDSSDAESIGTTKSGLKYLITKALLQTSTALNVCQYLIIKNGQAVATSNDDEFNILDTREHDNIKHHPVIGVLNQLNHLAGKLDSEVESKVDGLRDQMKNLVKASKLMIDGEESNEEDVFDEESLSGPDDGYDENRLDDNLDEDGDSDAIEESLSEDEEDEAAARRSIMNEARFSRRKNDDDEDQTDSGTSRIRRAVPTFSDFGDDDHADEADVIAANRSLAATVNKISQISKSKNMSKSVPEDDDQDNEDRFKRGLAMMDEELGNDEDDLSGEYNNELNSEDEEDEFYSEIAKKSKAKKEYKKSLYAVAPKYPGMDDEVEGERAITRQILKNRGLVAHKAKINRNPRVKKREQYRKALIKRKGAVREIRTEEGHRYAGEQTGIKSGLSRSRKLGVR